MVHEPASLSIWSLSIIPGGQRGAYVGSVEEMMCVLQRRNSGDGCELAST